MKNLIKRLLKLADIGIYRISKSKPNAQGLEIQSPIHHNTKERIDEFYSNPERVAMYADEKRQAFYSDVLELLEQNQVFLNGRKIADIGCGTGHLLLEISRNFETSRLVGYEYSEQAIQIATKVCPTATFKNFDIYQGDQETYDIIICTEVLEHLLEPDKALAVLLCMLAPGGALLLTVPDGRSDTFLGHINFWSPESWEYFIRISCDGRKYICGKMDDYHNYSLITNI